MSIRVARLALIAVLALFADAGAHEWPQFRGPTGQGYANAKRLPTTWSEGENIAWKTEIPGRGWSSPVIGDGRLWITTALEDDKSLRAMAVDAETGKVVQNVEIFQVAELPKINAKNSFASPSPVLDGDRLYVHFGTLGTACVDTKSGQVVWKMTELKLDHKEGPGSSPVVWGNLLIVNCDGIDTQYVAALDKMTGKLAWRTDRPGPLNPNPDFRKAYCTPLVIEHNGQPQLISPGADQVIAYEPATGKEIWKVRYQGFSNVPRPIFGDGLLFVCTGYMKPQIWAIRPGVSGDITETNVVWRFSKQAPSNPSPILVDDRVYMVSDQGVLTVIDAKTGKAAKQERLSGNYSASPIYADGKLFFGGEDGVVTVIEPGQEPKVLAKNELDGQIMASPAAVGSALYVRTDGHLYRIEQSNPRSANRPQPRSK